MNIFKIFLVIIASMIISAIIFKPNEADFAGRIIMVCFIQMWLFDWANKQKSTKTPILKKRIIARFKPKA